MKMMTPQLKGTLLGFALVVLGAVALLPAVNRLPPAGPSVKPLPPSATSQGGSSPERRLMRVTAYCPCRECCGPAARGITKSGHRVTDALRFCAASGEIPFDTTIDIPGYGTAVPVWDRGGAIKGDRIDVYFPSHQRACQWGVRWLWVTIHPARAEQGAQAAKKKSR